MWFASSIGSVIAYLPACCRQTWRQFSRSTPIAFAITIPAYTAATSPPFSSLLYTPHRCDVTTYPVAPRAALQPPFARRDATTAAAGTRLRGGCQAYTKPAAHMAHVSRGCGSDPHRLRGGVLATADLAAAQTAACLQSGGGRQLMDGRAWMGRQSGAEGAWGGHGGGGGGGGAGGA